MRPLCFRRFPHHIRKARSGLGCGSFAGFHVTGRGCPEVRQSNDFTLSCVTGGRAVFESECSGRVSLKPGARVPIHPQRPVHVPARRGGSVVGSLVLPFNGEAFELRRQRGLPGESMKVQSVLPVDYGHQRFEVVLAVAQRFGRTNTLRVDCELSSVPTEIDAPTARPPTKIGSG
ncbi:MAG: hypothetical protein AAF800_01195 [Planctomycetota bacterium]